MNKNEDQRFIELLSTTMMAYAKPLPEPVMIKFWMNQVAPFPMAVIERVFALHRQESRIYPPVPNEIVLRCIECDGRPSADEAWATAYLSADENSTVVWTIEMNKAMDACKLDIENNDKYAARKAFSSRYNALVAEARTAGRAVQWQISYGNDPRQRSEAAIAAYHKNLIPFNEFTMESIAKVEDTLSIGFVPAPESAMAITDESEGKRRIAELMAMIVPMGERLERNAKRRAEFKIDSDSDAKDESLKKFKEYSAAVGSISVSH